LEEQQITPRYTVIEDAYGESADVATHLHEAQSQVTLLYADGRHSLALVFRWYLGMEALEGRSVVAIADALLKGASAMHRARRLAFQGVALPAGAGSWKPA
jgi:hypothetical protein